MDAMIRQGCESCGRKGRPFWGHCVTTRDNGREGGGS
jgi:hypothetical protein